MATDTDNIRASYTYGTRGGSNAYRFKPDNKNRKFMLDGTIPDEVVLTYISTGIDDASTNYIPVYMEPVLEAYLNWQLSENDPQSPLGDRDRKQRLYYDRLRLVKKFETPPFSDIIDIFRKHISQSIRR